MSEPVTTGPKPWHRVVAGVITLVFLALAARVLADVGSGRPDLVKHVTGALALVFLVAGLPGLVALPWLWVRIYAVGFWLLPASIIWFGAEHFADWRAFILDGQRLTATTRTSVETVGSVIIGLGVVGLAAWSGCVAYSLRRRRDPSLPTLSQRIRRRTSTRPT